MTHCGMKRSLSMEIKELKESLGRHARQDGPQGNNVHSITVDPIQKYGYRFKK